MARQNSMLNLACSSSVGRWWMSAFGMCRFVPTRTRRTLLGPEVVGDDQVQQRAHGRVRERARRMRLDRHARIGKRPRRAEPAVDHARVVAAAGGAEEAALGLEDVARRGEAVARRARRRTRRSPPRVRRGTAWSSCRSSRAGRRPGWRRSRAQPRSSSASRPSSSRGGRPAPIEPAVAVVWKPVS